MAFDDNIFDTTVETTVTGSGNSATDNSNTLGVTLTDVGNEALNVTDAGNTDVAVDGSFHDGSYNQDWDIDDSDTTGSHNLDVSVLDESVTDNSINAGVREYNTGFSGTAGLGTAGGDLTINNQNTIVDQSLNGNILSGGGVHQWAGGESVVASGDGALAAGDDIDIDQTLIGGTNIDAGGDVLIDGSTKDVSVSIGSDNVTNTSVEITDASQDWDLDNVGNQYNATLTLNNSFTEETTDVDYDDWDVDADVIWDSTVTDIGDVDIDV